VTTVVELSRSAEPAVRGLRVEGELVEVETATGTERHLAVAEGWEVSGSEGTVRLKGIRRALPAREPLFDPNRPTVAQGVAWHAAVVPALDGSSDGFEEAEALALDYEDQYRRSEEPYPGPDEFSAVASALWDSEALYLAVDVVKPEVIVRPDDAPPLRFDNDPDDIHADGVQLYVRPAEDAPVYGFLVALGGEGRLRVRSAGSTAGSPEMMRGRWQPTEAGYRITLALTLPGWEARGGDTVGFDLLVNRMEPGRERRSGQLVWSGVAAGSTCAATGRIPPRSASWSCADGSGRGVHLHRQQAREALFGEDPGDAPHRMSRTAGCRVWDDRGREYLDYIMALGAVALGYGHPAVAAAAHAAIDAGVVGPLAPELEETVAAELCRLMPWIEQIRFVKTGAEGVAAAVRLARVTTGRARFSDAATMAGSTGARRGRAGEHRIRSEPCTPSFPSTTPSAPGA
jgi:hypothetical protein